MPYFRRAVHDAAAPGCAPPRCRPSPGSPGREKSALRAHSLIASGSAAGQSMLKQAPSVSSIQICPPCVSTSPLAM